MSLLLPEIGNKKGDADVFDVSDWWELGSTTLDFAMDLYHKMTFHPGSAPSPPYRGLYLGRATKTRAHERERG